MEPYPVHDLELMGEVKKNHTLILQEEGSGKMP